MVCYQWQTKSIIKKKDWAVDKFDSLKISIIIA